jgi:hypothetical protein
MNQSKFPLADLLTALGAIGFSFFCFLSLNFYTLGDTQQSAIVAIVIGFILGSLAFGAKLLKRTTGKFKTSIIFERLLLLLFVITAFISVFPFSHYFAVSKRKTEIKQETTSNITQANNIFVNYERYANNRLSIYENRLNSIVQGKRVNPSAYRNYGFVNKTDDQTQIKNRMFTLEKKLLPPDYPVMKKDDSTRLAYFKSKIINWSPLGIVEVMNTAEADITSWINQLKKYSTFRAQGEIAKDFIYPLTFKDVTDNFTELGSPTYISILIAIGFYVLMLLSYYFNTERSTKNHYTLCGKKTFNKSDIDIDIKF